MIYCGVKHENAQTTREARNELEKVRLSLLALHKALVDSERVQYEKTMGQITSPNHFLKLLTEDPWFAWLTPLSQMIVSIDEMLDGKEPVGTRNLQAVLKEARRLLVATEQGGDAGSGSGFSAHYYEALQRDPDVVMAHADVTKLCKPARGK